MKNKFSMAITLAVVLAMFVTSLALADNVQNDVTTDPASITLEAGNASSYVDVQFYVQPTGGGSDSDDGCNFDTTTEHLTFTIVPPSGVTAAPSSLTFNKCKVGGTTNAQTVRFSANASAVSGNISFTTDENNSGGTFSFTNAVFYVNVTTPPPPADTTAPVISYVLNPASPDGANGWYKSDVTLTWTVIENESPSSLVKTGCVNQNITSDQAATTYSCSATSDGGSASPVNVTIKRDATLPSITATPDPVANINGWNNTDVTVSYSCTDSGSGVNAVASSLGADSLAASGTASGTCVDMAGNSANASYTAQIDKIKPIITGSRTPPANDYGWNNIDVVVSFSCSDSGGSGLGTNTVAGATVSAEGAGQSVTNTGSCTDKAGNTADSATVTGIRIDKTAPTISASVAPDAALTGWWNISTGAPTVSFTCSDALSGLDGTCPSSHTFDEGADQFYSQTISDKAGNSASAAVTNVDVDLSAPLVSVELDRDAAASGWFNEITGAPIAQFTCSDTISGIVSCPSDYTFIEDDNQSHSGTAYDNAGNSASASVSDVDVDLTDPSITWNGGPAAGGSYDFGFVPAAPTCTAVDALSGPDGCTMAGYGNAVGPHTMNATAYDLAGNESTDNRSYSVLGWVLRGFYQPVDMNGVYNVVRNGSTVPLKFEIATQISGIEITDVSAIQQPLLVNLVTCQVGTVEDVIETVATGGTSLRYDTTGGQFIFNWKTPAGVGKCYRVTMTTQDGSFLQAFFKLK